MNQDDLRRQAIRYLQALQRAGVTDLPAVSATRLGTLMVEPPAELEAKVVLEPPAEPDSGVVAEAKSSFDTAVPAAKKTSTTATTTADSSTVLFDTGATDAYAASLSLPERAQALQVLDQQVKSCERCPELTKCRTQTVFGVGNPQPRLAFFGEGPGADEDRLGEPFVGRAGQLLNKIIEACQMAREDVYIFNTVKCRPPGNRNPHEVEIENCREYAAKQLEILQPEFICCLGSVAARSLLKTKDSVGRMRGKFHPYRGSQVVVTYHPAYLLRTPEAKAKTWDDMKMLMNAMGIAYQ